MTARLTAEQEFGGDDPLITLTSDGDKFLRDRLFNRLGSQLLPVRQWLGVVDNPMYQPTP